MANTISPNQHFESKIISHFAHHMHHMGPMSGGHRASIVEALLPSPLHHLSIELLAPSSLAEG